MIEFSLKGVKVRFTFWFFAVVTVMLLIDKTGLSLKSYIFHKLILTLLTAAWYLVLPV